MDSMTGDEARCLECGEPLTGRCDKKFCGDGCRNAYNNRRRGAGDALMRNVNRTLARNHRALADAFSSGARAVRLSDLEREGFVRTVFTGYLPGILGGGVYRCYDIAYRMRGGYVYLLENID